MPELSSSGDEEGSDDESNTSMADFGGNIQAAKEAKLKGAEDLGMLSSLLRWKRWGLAIEIEDCADELEAARLLLKHLHATDETVSYIMEAMGAEEGSVEGSVSKETFLGAVRGGVMEQEEIATFIESLDELEPKK